MTTTHAACALAGLPAPAPEAEYHDRDLTYRVYPDGSLWLVDPDDPQAHDDLQRYVDHYLLGAPWHRLTACEQQVLIASCDGDEDEARDLAAAASRDR